MRQTRSHALTAVISLVACSNAHAFKICVEKSSGLAEFEAIASNISASTGETWGAVVGGSASKCRDMLKAGTANLADLDAGKAYGVLLDSIKNSWPTGGGVALGKVGAGYQTMAVTRLDKMKADNVQTLCDILNKKTWRACHTGEALAMSRNHPASCRALTSVPVLPRRLYEECGLGVPDGGDPDVRSVRPLLDASGMRGSDESRRHLPRGHVR